MRRPVIAANWKMYKTLNEAVDTVIEIRRLLSMVRHVDIVIVPPFPFLYAVARKLEDSAIALGAQNMHVEKNGAFTGEVSAEMLVSVGCKYVILGHSERRQYFGETDDSVNRKIHRALEVGLIPIVCVGETLEEREAGRTIGKITGQILSVFTNVTRENAEKIVIAYEPIWAIGTGKTATPQQAEEVHGIIRRLIAERFGAETAEKIRIQYGGSVKPSNISELMKEKDIDGALVGGASLEAGSFSDIVKYKI